MVTTSQYVSCGFQGVYKKALLDTSARSGVLGTGGTGESGTEEV